IGYWGGIPYGGGIGGSPLSEYLVPGRGGRMPVSVTIEDPARRARDLPRNPVVAVLDTVVARHPWFTDPKRVLRLAVSDGELVPDEAAAAPTPMNLLTGEAPPVQGHGTFIAGLIRQGCPEATILTVPVMNDEGVAEEGDVLDALTALLNRHVDGQDGNRPGDCVDVVSLSLGYYAEDSSYLSSPVKQLLDRFAEHGILVVAGVGNDASTQAFVPAALAQDPPARITASSRPPLASVGAQNPDGTSIALFSNEEPVVSACRPGVSVISTYPQVNGAGEPTVVTGANGRRRTVDPDDYTGGFAAWSGTSFATPVLAAELAAELAATGDLTDVTDEAMRRRAVRALKECLARGGPAASGPAGNGPKGSGT
uniref:S8/S53 family peptidase n=1 Tax=Intrasporangium sp. TaxID=1925024 RepID=UPI0032218E4A